MNPDQIAAALAGTKLDNDLLPGTALILAAMFTDATTNANASAASAWLKAASILDSRFDAPAGGEDPR